MFRKIITQADADHALAQEASQEAAQVDKPNTIFLLIDNNIDTAEIMEKINEHYDQGYEFKGFSPEYVNKAPDSNYYYRMAVFQRPLR